MIIDKVMIAGADNKVRPRDLEILSDMYPFVEWGILFSKNKAGQERYPDNEWIEELCSLDVGPMSAHLCGAYPREILEQSDFREYFKLQDMGFKIFQLNYNFKYRQDKWRLNHWLDFAKLIKAFDERVILQYNKSNADFCKMFKRFPQVDILFDASGGRGTEIKEIKEPEWDSYTGYAGGLNEDNIERIAEQIINIDSNKRCWLDFESGARTDNKFDLDKAISILEKCEPYIKSF